MLYIDTCVLLAVLTPEAHSATATAFLAEASAPLVMRSTLHASASSSQTCTAQTSNRTHDSIRHGAPKGAGGPGRLCGRQLSALRRGIGIAGLYGRSDTESESSSNRCETMILLFTAGSPGGTCRIGLSARGACASTAVSSMTRRRSSACELLKALVQDCRAQVAAKHRVF